MTACPKCGKDFAVRSLTCPGCGVVLAKVQSQGPQRGRRDSSTEGPFGSEPASGTRGLATLVVGVVLFLFAVRAKTTRQSNDQPVEIAQPSGHHILGREVLEAPSAPMPPAKTSVGEGLPSAVTGQTSDEPLQLSLAPSMPSPTPNVESERFNVQVHGEVPTATLSAVMSALDRVYDGLAERYGLRLAQKIPVTLNGHTDYEVRGRPRWSDRYALTHDGSISAPIRGLPPSLARGFEETVAHEISHAFVNQMAGGLAQYELQEGLAQFMEGRRVESIMTSQDRQGLRSAKHGLTMSGDVMSLTISERLLQEHGQGKINNLLNAIRESGSEEGGFKRVFGREKQMVVSEILRPIFRRAQ